MLTKVPPQGKSVNLSIDADLIAEAKTLNVNLSRAAEQGIEAAISRRKREIWLEENADAIEENNRYFEKHGLPFAEYLGFS